MNCSRWRVLVLEDRHTRHLCFVFKKGQRELDLLGCVDKQKKGGLNPDPEHGLPSSQGCEQNSSVV